ncbi:hypothetical protein BCT94_17630 [Vibrio breoganii]|nr:hypothetical protein BCT94_17630 [Vibrio breoganii]
MSIVIFNWNNDLYLESLLSTLVFFAIKNNFTVYICDDGSTDNSSNIINTFVNNYNFLRHFQVCEKNIGRDAPYLGQLKALEMVINSGALVGTHVWLLDSDDYINEDIFNSITLKYDIGILNVVDINEFGVKSKYNINRKIGDNNNIWPTISPTSSLIVSVDFILVNRDMIFNFDLRFKDVWLDSRINMLSEKISKEKVKYLKERVYHRIHSNSDSFSMPLKRRIGKQITAFNYYKSIKGEKFKYSFRTFIIYILSVISDNK